MPDTAPQEQQKLTPNDLVYAAYDRCPCGAGLAYVPGSDDRAWDCSAILLGEAIPSGQPGAVQHTDRLPFAFWEIKTERSGSRLRTTRPTSPATAATGKDEATLSVRPAGASPTPVAEIEAARERLTNILNCVAPLTVGGGTNRVYVYTLDATDLRTVLDALAAQEAERRDSERLDWMEQNPGFDVQVYDEGVCVWDRAAERFVILDEANARAAIDAARQSTPTGATNE